MKIFAKDLEQVRDLLIKLEHYMLLGGEELLVKDANFFSGHMRTVKEVREFCSTLLLKNAHGHHSDL